MKQKQFVVGIAAFLLIFSCVIHITSAQVKSQSTIEQDKNKVKYRVTQLDSEIQEILWCGTDKVESEDGDTIDYEKPQGEKQTERKLFVLTEKGQLYISQDYGFTYKHLNQDIIKSTKSSFTNITFYDIMISPVNNRKVFFFGDNGYSFFTENCGIIYKPMKHHQGLRYILPNPTDHKLLLGLVPTECKKDDPECSSQTSDLYLTKDSGANWEKIYSLVEQAQWDKTKQARENNQNRILMAHYELKPDAQGNNTIHRKISYSDNFCRNVILVEKKGLRFYQSDDYIFVLTGGKQYGNYTLLIGPSYIKDGVQRSEINLPIKRAKDESFTVLDITDGQISIAINHEGDASGYTNVYVSNASGRKFTLSLMYAVGDSESNIDFEPINSNEGVFISNTYSSESIDKYKQVLSRKQGRKSSGTTLTVENFNLNEHQQSMISYNRGGSWHFIKAPQYDHADNEIKCEGECHLHLKGRTDSQGTPVYSTQNAPGLILATGNVGRYLSAKLDELKTYLSRDGGHTWKEIFNGSHEYEIADQGGIIAMARDDMPSEEIVYSLNEGETWNKLNFKKENKFTIQSFVTEYNNDEKHFIFYGTKTHDGAEVGVIGSINFTKVFDRECKGFDSPGDSDSDYERWTPFNFNGKRCTLGQRVSYIRKKTDSECFNNKSVSDLRTVSERCECTDEDFQCEFGYMMDKSENPKCVPINSSYGKEKQKPCVNGYYYETKGYRKIPNNKCEGGVEERYEPEKIRCSQEQDNISTTKVKIEESQSKEEAQKKSPQESIMEIAKSLQAQEEKEQSGSFSYMNALILFAILYVLYRYREEIIIRLKGIKSSLKASKNEEKDRYGYKSQANNAEQYSLFHNDDNEDEYDAEQL